MSAGRGLPAGTLTFLSTDIEGSTKLQTELGTDRYQDVLETHTRILRDAFKDGGVEIRVEGDALFVVFPVDADLDAAVFESVAEDARVRLEDILVAVGAELGLELGRALDVSE